MTNTQLAQFGHRAHFTRNRATREQRFTGIAVVAVVHAVVIYALLHVLGFVPMPPVPTILTGHFIPIEEQPTVPPPPPLPTVTPPPVQVNPVIDVPLVLVPPQETAITPPRPVPQSVVPPILPALPPPPAFHPARAIAATHTTPDYPPISRRLGEQGTLRLRLAISEEGLVTGAQLVRSSGFRRLDDAAIAWVTQHWRYSPALQGGKPVPTTAEALVTFQLH